jgi:hypothetical protein
MRSPNLFFWKAIGRGTRKKIGVKMGKLFLLSPDFLWKMQELACCFIDFIVALKLLKAGYEQKSRFKGNQCVA